MPLLAQVIVDVRTRDLDKPFDYLVPERLHGRIQAGHRVYVPFARQHVQGFVLAVWREEHLHRELKEVAAVLDELPLFSPTLLELAKYMRTRTLCTWLSALQSMVPGAYRARGVRRYLVRDDAFPVPVDEAADEAVPDRVLWTALRSAPLSFDEVVKKFGPSAVLSLEQGLHAGWVSEVVEAQDVVRAKMVSTLESPLSREQLAGLAAERESRAPRQAALLRALSQGWPQPVELRQLGLRPSDAAVRAVIREGFAAIGQVQTYRVPLAAALTDHHPRRELTTYQARAVEAILQKLDESQSGEVGASAVNSVATARLPWIPQTGQRIAQGLVLSGVTGSGKTEVYLQVIEEALNRGGGVIALVPEISLTPQMVARFTSRFGDQVAVLHSSLSAGERRDEWERVRHGEARVVVGARSAVFAPVQSLSLVIVDEAHEATYKQDESPHYDAREIALWRAFAEHAVVVFGSATPSMELFHAAQVGVLGWLTMPFRVEQQAMPKVAIVDMRDELKTGNAHLFSTAMREGLERAVGSGRQALLFLNRRGYASFVLCRQCGNSAQCPNCDIALTLHRQGASEWLECHYCEYREPFAATCTVCGEAAVRPFGVGTEQVEQVVRELWPTWRVLRMDVDTTRRKGAHHEAVEQVLAGKVDVLLGTQMIAKGLDFPNLSFVGVVAADTMLNLPDFRAAERTYSLLTQVIGRAGRTGVQGETVIQTFRPDHFAVRAAARHDMSGFYAEEMEFRRTFAYPPFCELAVFVASHEQEPYARGAAQRFERELRRGLQTEQVTVLPAVPSGIRRAKGQFRYQVVVKYVEWEQVQSVLQTALDMVSSRMRALGGRCTLDINALRI
ncbi:replication restart helicase PriA [Alicyclobacillus sp. ALC3]|uniref:replication restart helicase PriA n=1 Tax=Alicyclobacillus sp. ALC3 TaxID=2796143 RepID=UPI002377ECC2|nr:primosomal protein N' [Alicyclobacillus sp. ALC3]WDL97416.1 primosomal protein N' [Alicyclobacillus sp. ALC3]